MLHGRRPHLHPRYQCQRSKPVREYLWRPRCSYNKPTGYLVYRLDRRDCGGTGWADTSPLLLWTRLAGPISVFTATAATTASPVGPTTTRVRPILRENVRFLEPLLNLPEPSIFVRFSTDNGLTWTSGDRPRPHLYPRRPDHRRLAHGDRLHRRHGRRRRWLPPQRHQSKSSDPPMGAPPGETPTPAPLSRAGRYRCAVTSL